MLHGKCFPRASPGRAFHRLGHVRAFSARKGKTRGLFPTLECPARAASAGTEKLNEVSKMWGEATDSFIKFRPLRVAIMVRVSSPASSGFCGKALSCSNVSNVLVDIASFESTFSTFFCSTESRANIKLFLSHRRLVKERRKSEREDFFLSNQLRIPSLASFVVSRLPWADCWCDKKKVYLIKASSSLIVAVVIKCEFFSAPFCRRELIKISCNAIKSASDGSRIWEWN